MLNLKSNFNQSKILIKILLPYHKLIRILGNVKRCARHCRDLKIAFDRDTIDAFLFSQAGTAVIKYGERMRNVRETSKKHTIKA